MDNKQITLELGTKPVGKLLLQYAIPAIIATTASSLYNVVDSIFIGQGVGPLAISGLAITFPFMNLSGAFCTSVGIGAATSISLKLGQKDYATAENILGNTIVLGVLVGLLFGALGMTFLDPILRFFGASDHTLPYAHDYMSIILCGSPITFLYFGLNAILRSDSKPRQAMFTTIFSVVLNAALCPIFIYHFNLGMRGAAIATMTAQVVALAWQIHMFSERNGLLRLQRGIYRLKPDLVKKIFSIGVSPFAMNACACVVVIFITNSLVRYGGDMAVGAYGIANRIAFIFIMITIGLNQGMQPIAGYNYGAQRMDRLMRVLKYAIIVGMSVMTVGWILAMLSPKPLVRMFTTDETLIKMSIKGLQTIMLVFPVVGYQMVVTNFFTSTGRAKTSMFLSLSRQLLFLVPMLIILPTVFGVSGVWSSMPVADSISVVVTFVVMTIYMRKSKKQYKQTT